MAKRVFIIHGWGDSPEKHWIPWLKEELEEKDFDVIAPQMPDTDKPEIKKWVSHLKEIVEKPDKDTYFIGHSIGCQAIMRYLETLDKNQKIGGAIFVAGWFNLTEGTWDKNFTREIANPWIKTIISFDKIKSHTKKFMAIQSDNDPYVSLADADIFRNKLF